MSDSNPQTEGLNRRRFLKATGIGTSVVLAGCSGNGGGGDGGGTGTGGGGGGSNPSITAGRLADGMSSVIQPLIVAKEFDKKHGFDMSVTSRADINTYYGDFASGTYVASAHGSIGTTAGQYNSGVPIKIIGGYSLPSVYVLAKEGSEITSLEAIQGKQIAAPIGAGAYKITNVLAKKDTGKSIDQLAKKVINAPGPSNPILELEQGNVEMAISWEPAITTVTAAKDIDLKRVYSMRQGYKDVLGKNGRYLIWVVNNSEGVYDDHPEMMSGLLKASRDVLSFIKSDPQAATDLLTENTDNPPAIKKALDDVANLYQFPPVTEIQDILTTQWELASDLGAIEKVPDDGIFGTDPFE